MNTRRQIDTKYRAARDRRKEAIEFFHNQQANVNMPLVARNVAGYIARGLEAIYRSCYLTGDDKDFLFKAFIQRAKKHGHV